MEILDKITEIHFETALKMCRGRGVVRAHTWSHSLLINNSLSVCAAY